MKLIALSMLISGLLLSTNDGFAQHRDTQKRTSSSTSTRIDTEEENRKYGTGNPNQVDSISGNRENTRGNNMPEKSSVTSPEKNMKVPKEGTKIDNNPNRNAIGR